MSSITTHKRQKQSGMKLSVIIRIAKKNLFSKKLRTGLTVLAVVIGVGAVVFLISFSVGLQKLVEKQVIGSRSIKTVDVTASQTKSLKLDDTAIQKLNAIPSVNKIGKVYTEAGKIKTNNSESTSVVYGVDQAYIDLSSFNKVSGKVFKPDSTSIAAVNTSFLKIQGITDNNKAINQTITLSFTVPATTDTVERQVSKDLKIIGVIESGSGSEVFVSNKIFEEAGITNASQVKVLASSRDDVAKVRSQIESRGYTTASPLDTISEIDKIFQLLQIVLAGFGGIGMVIAVLGMFNTLTINLLERTREIGLIVTIGGQQKDISRLFMTEALMLSLLGGSLGVFFAFLIGIVGDIALNVYAHSNGVTESLTAFYVSPVLVLISLALTAIIGLGVVFIPAKRAARISPLDAMRE